MKRFAGFILFEYVIYVGCSALIMLCLMQLIATFFPAYKKTYGTSDTLLGLVIAQHYLAQDLESASMDSQVWKKLEPHELIWHSADKDYGWSLHKKSLIRSVGLYNGKTWQQRIKTTVDHNIDKLEFTKQFNAKKRLIGIEYALTKNSQTVKRFTALTGRALCSS